MLDIAEQYAYNRSGETFVFLQDGYHRFSETVDKLLETTTRADLNDEPPDEKETVNGNYTGEVPAVVRLNGETHEVSSWTEYLVTIADVVLSQAGS